MLNAIMRRYNDEQRASFYKLIGMLQREAADRYHVQILDLVLLAEIAQGDISERPWDVASLALYLALPRSSIRRHLQPFVDQGYLESRRQDRRVVYLRTEKCNRHFRPLTNRVIDEIIRYVRNQHGGVHKK